MPFSVRGSAKDLIDYDDARPSAPFEHGLVVVAALGLLAGAWLTRSRGAAVCQAALGGALLVRAAGGRDGVRRWARAEEKQAPLQLVISR